jgi:chromosomal replication initiation ATPase DnaA
MTREERIHWATDELLRRLEQEHGGAVPEPVIEDEPEPIKIEIKSKEAAALRVDICILPIPKPRITVEYIKRMVCRYFNISHDEIIGQRRDFKFLHPRMIGMYLSQTLTNQTYAEIGRRFGDRDHSTVIHSVNKIEQMLGMSDPISEHVKQLQEMLAA